jgi:DNA mismatch endonuclease (patch repair protein)
MMSGIRGRDTKPEIIVRKYLHAAGMRFRLAPKDLPGRPDIVLPKYRTVVFVHGCFWHRHPNCHYTATPKSNAEFWQAKFASNIERDALVQEKLTAKGWNVLVVWGCQTSKGHLDSLVAKIRGK